MKLSDLNEQQMFKVLEKEPLWLFKHKPHFVAFYRPDWCCKFTPNWMTENYPSVMLKYNADWVLFNRPEFMWMFDMQQVAERNPVWAVMNRQEACAFYFPEILEEWCNKTHRDLRPEVNGGAKYGFFKRICMKIASWFTKPQIPVVELPDHMVKLLPPVPVKQSNGIIDLGKSDIPTSQT